MHKTNLFIFFLISITTFSSSAMEIANQAANLGQYYLSNTTESLLNWARQKPQLDQSNIVNPIDANRLKYIDALKTFNYHAELLKKDPTKTHIRLQMIDDLKNIKPEINFIVNCSKKSKKKSLRVGIIDLTIDQLKDTTIFFDSSKIELCQNIINTVADFTIDKNTNITNFSDSVCMLKGSKLLALSDEVLLSQYPELAQVVQLNEQARIAEEEKTARLEQEAQLAQQARIAEEEKTARLEQEARLAEQARITEKEKTARLEQEARLAEQARIAEEEKATRLEQEAQLAEQARIDEKEKATRLERKKAEADENAKALQDKAIKSFKIRFYSKIGAISALGIFTFLYACNKLPENITTMLNNIFSTIISNHYYSLAR